MYTLAHGMQDPDIPRLMNLVVCRFQHHLLLIIRIACELLYTLAQKSGSTALRPLVRIPGGGGEAVSQRDPDPQGRLHYPAIWPGCHAVLRRQLHHHPLGTRDHVSSLPYLSLYYRTRYSFFLTFLIIKDYVCTCKFSFFTLLSIRNHVILPSFLLLKIM